MLLNADCPRSVICGPTNKLLKHVNLEYYKRYLTQIGWIEGRDYSINLNEMWLEYTAIKKKIFFISTETWKNIVAWEFDVGWLDEPGWYPQEMFDYIAERIRAPGKVNQLLMTGVTQGATPFFNQYASLPYESRGTYVVNDRGTPVQLTRYKVTDHVLVMHGSTHENWRLPNGYVPTLYNQYGHNKNLWDAHVHGLMVPVTSQNFYYEFVSSQHVGEYPLLFEWADPFTRQSFFPPLYLSWDSNVGMMTWVVIQHIAGEYRVCKENGSNARNIPEAVKQFVEAFPPSKWKNHPISVLGDASLHKRSDQTYTTGYEMIMHLLRQAGYNLLELKAHIGNPFVYERSDCTNRLFARGELKIDRSCVKVVSSFATSEADGKGGIKKPTGETTTHPAEAVDMALIVLEPNTVRTGYGLNI